ncbi:Spc7 kinetochore protein-domain-containing protein [Globomyces pollinis-pini]|nr:Spc7 kinetochore protein-domain-containing protein [Globomyces pollinis-pini]
MNTSEKPLQVAMERRKSSGRRVSFAAQAHVRLFETDVQEEDDEEAEIAKTLAMFAPVSDQTDRNIFDLSIAENSEFASKNSFEINLTGSPKLDNNTTPQKHQPSNYLSSLFISTPTFSLGTRIGSTTPLLDKAIQEARQMSNSEPSTPIKHPDIVLAPPSTTKSVRSTMFDTTMEQTMDMSIDQSEQELDQEESMNFGANISNEMEHMLTPKAEKTATVDFPKLTPKRLTTPRAISSSSAINSPWNDENNTKLKTQSKYRDSIAPFFQVDNNSDLESPIGKADVFSSSANEMVNSSPVASEKTANKPAKNKNKRRKPRDTIGNFFPDLESPMAAKPNRDTIANFFPPTDSPIIQQKKRDTIANFFPPQDLTDADSSFDSNQSLVLTSNKSQSDSPMDLDSTGSITEGDHFDKELAKLRSAHSQMEAVTDDVLSSSPQKRMKVRDSITPFFHTQMTSDSSILEESMVLDESQDLTENHFFEPEVHLKPKPLSTNKQHPLAKSNSGSSESSVYPKSLSGSSLESLESSLGATDNLESSMVLESTDPDESIEFSMGSDHMTSTPTKSDTYELASSQLSLNAISPVNPIKKEDVLQEHQLVTPKKSSRRKSVLPEGFSPRSSPRLRSVGKSVSKSTTVTPMRRAVASKMLASATKAQKFKTSDAEDTPQASSSAMVNPLSESEKLESSKTDDSPLVKKQSVSEKRNSSRKSIGGSLQKSLQIDDSASETEGLSITEADVVEKTDCLPVDLPESAEDIGSDLMDEQHLSIMDTSMVKEGADTFEIVDLTQFLVATNIQFQTFPPAAEFNLNALSANCSTLVEVVQNNLDSFYNDCFFKGCQELVTTIGDLEVTIEKFKEEIAETTPLLFEEFAQGTETDKDELMVNLRHSKLFCYQAAKSDWYSWKSELLLRIQGNMDQFHEDLQADSSLLSPILLQSQKLQNESEEYNTFLSSELKKYKTNHEMKLKVISEAKENLTNEAVQRREKFLQLKAQLEEKRKTSLDTKSKLESIKNRCEELKVKIQKSEKTCSELVVFDPSELTSLRSNFSLLLMLHSLRPLELGPVKQTWVYDDMVQITFTKHGETFGTKSQLHFAEDYKKASFLTGKHSEAQQLCTELLEPVMNNHLTLDVGFTKSDGQRVWCSSQYG